MQFYANHKKQIHVAALGLASVVALWLGLRSAYELVAIGVGYKAKVLCSDVFLSGRGAESVLAEDLAVEDLAPLQLIDAYASQPRHEAWASFFGLVEREAGYSPELGCILGMPAAVAVAAPPPSQAKAPDLPSKPDARLDEVLDWAFAEPDPQHLRRTRALLVLKDGVVVAERYAPGFGPDMPLPGWSLAKSVTATLVGILVGQGRMDLAAFAPVPEWQKPGDRRSTITLDQLMRMSSGLEFSEEGGEALSDVTRMLFLRPDTAAYAAAKPLEAKPGTLWHYASGTTNILSRIIRRTLGEAEYRDFPRRALFAPLGMDSARFEFDASGTFVGSSFIYATARDWAKFGQLYMQDGLWQGRKILPSGWVGYSATPAPAAPHGEYGAHFWLDVAADYHESDPEPPLPMGTLHAVGHEGQYVSIVPSRGLVVVRLGLTRQASAWRQDRLINKIIAALGI